MDSKGKVKNRSVNFTPMEETLLAYFVKKHKGILENKKTDAVTNADKNKCWVMLEKEFNAESGASYRSAQILKKKYENMKKQTKKKISEEKCYRFGTGGGPFQEFTLTEADQTVIEILGETRVHGLATQFGGDAGKLIIFINHERQKFLVLIPSRKPKSTPSNAAYIFSEPKKIKTKPNSSNVHTPPSPTQNLETHNNEVDIEAILIYTEETEEATQNDTDRNNEIEYVEDNGLHEEIITEENLQETVVDIHEAPVETWSKYNPTLLKTPKSKALKPSTKTGQNVDNVISKKISQWATVKSSLEEEKRRYLEEEHETKITLMKALHDEELNIMKRESQIRILRSEEEKKIIIEGLKEEQKQKKEIFELQKLKLLKEMRK
ncbi:unnamed protein product [Ceutorhynchus assimilis]|uniref:Regulatory protein zeste n=1 Tax=Ceutorhynchus assimilis TaxID=467358 RepID=A0A9N9MKU5_9CUCU|nr:unnamed protein product [Ceutorhynchus assimilis]